MLRKRKATQPGSVVSILAGRSGASKGRSSPCSLRCAWLRSRFAPLTRPLLPAELTAGRLQGMVLSVSPGDGGLITTVVLRQRQRATTLGAFQVRNYGGERGRRAFSFAQPLDGAPDVPVERPEQIPHRLCSRHHSGCCDRVEPVELVDRRGGSRCGTPTAEEACPGRRRTPAAPAPVARRGGEERRLDRAHRRGL